MPVAGANPRLGQGMPGGSARLPGGLPLPGGGVTGLPTGTIPAIPGLPHLAGGSPPVATVAPLAPRPTVVDNGAAAGNAQVAPEVKANYLKQNMQQNSASTRSMVEALGVLAKVEKGKLKPDKAAKLMQGLTPGDQDRLANIVGAHFSATGKTNINVLKTLQSLQTLPAPTDSEPHDLLSNFARDASGLITGLPAGIGLTAAYLGKDTYNTLRGHPTTNLMDKILKPVGHAYAKTYSPALHGDFGKTLHAFHEHPLQPLLDVASVASLGAGTAARVGAAGDAIQAGRIAELAGGAKGVAKVGDSMTVHEMKNGLYGVRDGNNWVAANLPDKNTAIAHAQSLSVGQVDGLRNIVRTPALGETATPAGALKLGAKGALRAGSKGGLIDLYDNTKGHNHEAEITQYMQEVKDVLDDPNLRMNRRTMGQVVKDVAADIRATRASGKARPGEMAGDLPGFISSGSTGRALSTGETALREASDLVRAGAIYLRPAYLPNNWAGNGFMSAVHQGVLAPVNLAKSLVVDKHIGKRYTAAMDKSLGTNPSEAIATPTGRGYVSSLTQPIAHVMGTIADQPFRRAAWLHEARKMGYTRLSDVKTLFDRASGTGADSEAALRDIGNIARRSQEEIVKFGHMNDAERSLIRNLVFVYSWMRGAGRYAGRFPLQHPIQTQAFNQMSGPGNDYVQSIMGGMPSFLQGSVPVGRDKNGNPILINPFSLNPLGTGLQIMRAAAGTINVLRDPKSFNKYAQQDVVGLLNPLAGAYIDARSGGQPVKKQLTNTIAALALKRGLQHPGSGSIYPTTRTEAVGHFAIGSLFPRVADQAAVTKALERENVGHPAALIPQQMKDFKKATGEDIPFQLVSAYKGDLEALALQKSFQQHYADSHGASGFRHMPPQNRVEAALDFLTHYSHLPPDQLKQLKDAAKQMTTDAQFNSYANALWNMTGTGQYKQAWDNMMRTTKGSDLTRKR